MGAIRVDTARACLDLSLHLSLYLRLRMLLWCCLSVAVRLMRRLSLLHGLNR